MPCELTGKKILVTGATGFIGRHLMTALRERGASLYALVRDPAKLALLWPNTDIVGRVGNMEHPDSLRTLCQGMETVFHLASLTHIEQNPVDNERYERLTLESTRSLLAAAIDAGVKQFIYVSSVKSMGEGDSVCLDESSPTHPITPYGQAKRAAEELVLAAGLKYGMHVCVLRLPLVYGHDNKGNIYRMIAAIDRGRLPLFPKVHNKRSMVHVDDVVQALLLTASRDEARDTIYIVTDSEVYSTRQIYDLICLALGRSVGWAPVPTFLWKVGARMGDLISWFRGKPFLFNSEALNKLFGSAWYSSDKIRRELGFKSEHTLKTALSEMVTQYRKDIQGNEAK